MSIATPRQNRVDPWSRPVATSARGQWFGNRGCLHNDAGRIVRDYQLTRWIICVLEFRGRRRALMQPGRYTELFFLDEATALAAGHRPCAECQRARYNLFRDAWAKAHGHTERLPATAIDAALHTVRWADGRKVTYRAPLRDLPTGTMVAALDDDTPHLLAQGQLWQWDFTGYTPTPAWDATAAVRVLTPQPTVAILAAGYPVQLDPSCHSGSIHR